MKNYHYDPKEPSIDSSDVNDYDSEQQNGPRNVRDQIDLDGSGSAPADSREMRKRPKFSRN